MSQPCTSVTITVESCQGCVGTCDQCSICVSSTTYSFCNSSIEFISATPSAPSGINGGDGGGGGANADPNEIVIDPNLANLDLNKINLFLTNLRTTDLAAYNYFNSHSEIKNQVMSYLFANYLSEESTIFAKSFINQCVLNPTLHLDLNASSKSPFFVDLSLVSGNTPEELKFQEVYSDLMSSPKFRLLFNSLFNESPFINVKFSIENLPQNNLPSTLDGITGGAYILNQLSTLSTIKIDRQHLLTKSKVNIAITILHECIHAFLNVKLRHPSITMPISQINNMNFQQLVNTYYNGFSNGEYQHDFFINNMFPTMLEILQDIQDLIITPQQANELNNPTNGGAILYQPIGSPPTISDVRIRWNWNTLFYHLIFNGLQNCTAFPFNQSIVTNEDYYHYKYISCFNIIFNP